MSPIMIVLLVLIALIVVLSAVAGILGAVIKRQKKQIEHAASNIKQLQGALVDVESRVARLNALNATIEKVDTNAEQTAHELAATPDSALVDRANALFGVRDPAPIDAARVGDANRAVGTTSAAPSSR